jgi:hypothetical protein
MVMKGLIAAAGVGVVVICAAFAAAAKPGGSIERSLRMVSDAVRDDVRTAAVGDASAKNASPQRSPGVRSRRRPHMNALPRGRSERNIRLRQEQQKSN